LGWERTSPALKSLKLIIERLSVDAQQRASVCGRCKGMKDSSCREAWVAMVRGNSLKIESSWTDLYETRQGG